MGDAASTRPHPEGAVVRFGLILICFATLMLHGAAAEEAAFAPDAFEAFDGFEEEFSAPAEEEAVADDFDPLSGYNRVMTRFNDFVYINALFPVARGYEAVVPSPGRLAVSRVFKNIKAPVRIVNNLLQFKVSHAAEETTRFLINSTVGILGIFDPAADWFGLDAHPEDFGQTLGYYGVGPGFHLVLPVLGPSNLRDTVSLWPDWYLDPTVYTGDHRRLAQTYVEGLASQSFYLVNESSLNYKLYESMRKDAVDLYPFLKNIYEQSRIKAIEE